MQMKHCHRLLSGLAVQTHPFAWFSEGKAGPSLAPWSPEAQVAPVLAYKLDPAARWPRPKAHEFPSGGRVLLQAWPTPPKPSQAQLTLGSSGSCAFLLRVSLPQGPDPGCIPGCCERGFLTVW